MSDRKHTTHTGANFALVLVQEAFMLLRVFTLNICHLQPVLLLMAV